MVIEKNVVVRSEQEKQERYAVVGERNRLKRELEEMNKRLAKMEAHEGEDGCAEDIDGQCKLVDEIAEKQRRFVECGKILGYYKN